MKAGKPRVLKQGKASRRDVSKVVSLARSGNVKAHKQLVETYSYLPLHFATTNGADTEHRSAAIKVGMEALQLAIDHYQLDDPEHFTVYARRWINRRIQIYLRSFSKPAEVKRTRLSKYNQQIDFRTEALRALGNQVKLRLNAQQYAIIGYRYGLNGKSRKTLDEVAELLGVSRQRIRHVESQAIKKLLSGKLR
jgi:RNA polymerase sigma factor (sigma-70 family)